jgi:hypothetical protein
VKWVTTNAVRFVAVEASYVALLGVLAQSVEIAITTLIVALLTTAPFFPIYLAAIAALPARWSDRRRRLAAVAASPLLVTLFAAAASQGGFLTFLFALALPGALIYGAVVRLRERTSDARTG